MPHVIRLSKHGRWLYWKIRDAVDAGDGHIELTIAEFIRRYVQTEPTLKGECLSCGMYYVLTSHAMTHAAAVAIVTGSVWLSLFEAVAHWFIDLAKCEGWTGIHVDQALHVVCKMAWVGLIAWGVN